MLNNNIKYVDYNTEVCVCWLSSATVRLGFCDKRNVERELKMRYMERNEELPATLPCMLASPVVCEDSLMLLKILHTPLPSLRHLPCYTVTRHTPPPRLNKIYLADQNPALYYKKCATLLPIKIWKSSFMCKQLLIPAVNKCLGRVSRLAIFFF